MGIGGNLAPGAAENAAQHAADDLASYFAADGTGGAFDHLFARAGTGAPGAAAQQVTKTIQNAALWRRVGLLACLLV